MNLFQQQGVKLFYHNGNPGGEENKRCDSVQWNHTLLSTNEEGRKVQAISKINSEGSYISSSSWENQKDVRVNTPCVRNVNTWRSHKS